jgi:hypothetical protein
MSSPRFTGLRRLPWPLRLVMATFMGLAVATSAAACGSSSKAAVNDPQAAMRTTNTCSLKGLRGLGCKPTDQMMKAVQAHGWMRPAYDAHPHAGDSIQMFKVESDVFKCGAWMVMTKPASSDNGSDAEYVVGQVIDTDTARPPLLAKDLPASLQGTNVTEKMFDEEVVREMRAGGSLHKLCLKRWAAKLPPVPGKSTAGRQS